MKAPTGIKLTTFLMTTVVLLHLVAAVASDLPGRWNVSRGLFAYSATVFGVAVAGIAFVLFESVVLWFYWHRRSWARWVVLAGCLLAFVSLRHFIVGPPVNHARTIIIVYRMAVAVVEMVYLSTREARWWFDRGHRPVLLTSP